MKEIEESEYTNLFHHEIHKKKITKSTILEIEHNGKTYCGHKDVSKAITESVAELLENKFFHSEEAQKDLLKEVKPVFTSLDNDMLTQLPDKEEVLSVLKESNLHSAPGTDGITNYFYLKMFDTIGEALTRVIVEI